MVLLLGSEKPNKHGGGFREEFPATWESRPGSSPVKKGSHQTAGFENSIGGCCDRKVDTVLPDAHAVEHCCAIDLRNRHHRGTRIRRGGRSGHCFRFRRKGHDPGRLRKLESERNRLRRLE